MVARIKIGTGVRFSTRFFNLSASCILLRWASGETLLNRYVSSSLKIHSDPPL